MCDTKHFDNNNNMSTTPNDRVVETAAKSLDDDDVVLEMIRACAHKNQCYSCGEDESVVDEKIVNDECAYTFASPFVLSRGEKEQQCRGIFVNMKTRRAVSRKYLRLDSRKTNRQGLYLERRFRKVFDDVKIEEEEKEEKRKSTPITKLGVGIHGGFEEEDFAKPKYTVAKEERIVVYDCERDVILAGMKVDFEKDRQTEEARNDDASSKLPTVVFECAKTISKKEGYDAKKDVMASWEDVPNVSKYSENLVQVKSEGKTRISPDPKTWKCFETGETTNLWLNLSDGVIGSGRRHFDGSGGNGSALRHYQSEKTKGNEYPLVVKLGTITPDGADVYSYAADEDDAVTDPKLAEHLKFWGIDIMSQVKTEQTMNEIQIDKNRTFEFDAITEHGKDLREVSGEGLIGLRNLGNSCYVNSVVQVMKECANVRKVFADEKQKEHVFETGNSGGAKAIENDPLAQTVKLFSSLTSSEYARTSEELSDETQKKQDLRGLAEGLAPRMFKRLIGEGHAEFSTARQQDAREFFEHCLEKFDKWQKDGVRESRFFANEHAGGVALSSISSEFQFETLARTVCGSSHKAKFEVGSHTVLDMCVPREKAVKIETTKEELETAASKRQKKEGEEDAPAPLEVPFATCLETFTQESIIEDYYSPAIQGKTFATRKTFLKTCPNVLALCVNRYYVGDDWRPTKMDCVVNVPERLNIESMRVDEKKDVDAYELLPEDVDMDANAAANAAPAANEITADDAIVAQLVAMGFSENGSKRAAIATSNASAEVAMEWVFAHSEDPDFNDPPVTTMDLSKDVDKTNSVSVETISQLESMGFSSAASRTALRVSGNSNSVEAACEWLFANMDNIDDACAKAERELEEKEQAGRDASSTNDTTTNEIIDGKGEYELFGVVSHMGSNTACGHYVAHVKKNNQWILFNDEKVAVSESPPLGLGYLYFFRRL